MCVCVRACARKAFQSKQVRQAVKCAVESCALRQCCRTCGGGDRGSRQGAEGSKGSESRRIHKTFPVQMVPTYTVGDLPLKASKDNPTTRPPCVLRVLLFNETAKKEKRLSGTFLQVSANVFIWPRFTHVLCCSFNLILSIQCPRIHRV